MKEEYPDSLDSTEFPLMTEEMIREIITNHSNDDLKEEPGSQERVSTEMIFTEGIVFLPDSFLVETLPGLEQGDLARMLTITNISIQEKIFKNLPLPKALQLRGEAINLPQERLHIREAAARRIRLKLAEAYKGNFSIHDMIFT